MNIRNFELKLCKKLFTPWIEMRPGMICHCSEYLEDSNIMSSSYCQCNPITPPRIIAVGMSLLQAARPITLRPPCPSGILARTSLSKPPQDLAPCPSPINNHSSILLHSAASIHHFSRRASQRAVSASRRPSPLALVHQLGT